MVSTSSSRCAIVLLLVALSAVHANPKAAVAWTKTLSVYVQELRRSHSDANLLTMVNLKLTNGVNSTTFMGKQYRQVTSFNEVQNDEN